MSCRSVIPHTRSSRYIYDGLSNSHHFRPLAQLDRIIKGPVRHVTTSTKPEPASDDHAPVKKPLTIRKLVTQDRISREDVFIDSLSATLEAHRRRAQRHSMDSVPPSSSTPPGPRIRMHLVNDPKGGLHPASFEDFQSQHKPGDEEWERRIGPNPGKDTPIAAEAEAATSSMEHVDTEGTAPDFEAEESPPPLSHARNKAGDAQRSKYLGGRVQPIKPPFNSCPTLPQSLILTQGRYFGRSQSDELLGTLILQYEEFLRIAMKDHAGANPMAGDLARVIEETLPDGATLQLHGSYATKLASPLSDIDLNISLPEDPDHWLSRGPSPERLQIQRLRSKILRQVKEALQARQLALHTETIEAKLPVLIVQDPDTRFTYKISCGRKITARTTMVQALLDEYPTLRPLFMLLRYALLIRGLNETESGGVGSHTLLIMILTALKHTKSVLLGELLGQQLVSVLDFWQKADLHDVGYAAVPPLAFPKHGKRAPWTTATIHEEGSRTGMDQTDEAAGSGLDTEAFDRMNAGISWLQAQNRELVRRTQTSSGHLQHTDQLCLLDPVDPSNDLGYRSYRMPDVIETLRYLSRELHLSKTAWDEGSSRYPYQPAKSNLLWPFVASNQTAMLNRRKLFRDVAKGSK